MGLRVFGHDVAGKVDRHRSNVTWADNVRDVQWLDVLLYKLVDKNNNLHEMVVLQVTTWFLL